MPRCRPIDAIVAQLPERSTQTPWGATRDNSSRLAADRSVEAKRKDRHVASVQMALAAVIAILDQSLLHDNCNTRKVPNAEVARLKRIFAASLRSDDEP